MDISSEFKQAVRDKKLLRIRIMLKDSLLVDKTFRSFDKMQAYASTQNASPWVDADMPLEKKDKPWTEDTMNYELTALVNDFTKEHVNYVKAIITDIYKQSMVSSDTSDVSGKTPVSQSVAEKRPGGVSAGSKRDPYSVIPSEIVKINRILKKNKDELTGKRRWYSEDVNAIKRYAQAIVDACNEIQGRG